MKMSLLHVFYLTPGTIGTVAEPHLPFEKNAHNVSNFVLFGSTCNMIQFKKIITQAVFRGLFLYLFKLQILISSLLQGNI